MWKALRPVAKSESPIRPEPSAPLARTTLPKAKLLLVALLVILWPGAKLEAKQVRRISRFQENAIPIYYSGSPHGIYSAVVGAAQSIDLGMNYYP